MKDKKKWLIDLLLEALLEKNILYFYVLLSSLCIIG